MRKPKSVWEEVSDRIRCRAWDDLDSEVWDGEAGWSNCEIKDEIQGIIQYEVLDVIEGKLLGAVRGTIKKALNGKT